MTSILYAEGKELAVRERWKYHYNRDTCWSTSHFVERNRLDRVERENSFQRKVQTAVKKEREGVDSELVWRGVGGI